MAMLLGLANGNIPSTPAEFTDELISGWADLGVRCLSVHFAGGAESVLSDAPALSARLAHHGIHVAQMAGVNANFVHHDPDVRDAAHRRVLNAIPTAVALDASMISSGAGTNRDDWADNFYGPHPDNFSAASKERLIEGLRAIAPHIEDAGISYTIECHQLSAMRSAQDIRDVMDGVDSPVITANFDPVNLLDSAVAVFDNAARMRQMIDIVGPRYGASCHLKDVRVTDEFVCRIIEEQPGKGVLDVETFFKVTSRLPGPTPLIVEHLAPDTFADGLRYVRERALAAGVELL